MVQAVRNGLSMHATAKRFGVSVGAVAFWVTRAGNKRLDRVDWTDRKPGRAWNRTRISVERKILALREKLRGDILGEWGAAAIRRALGASQTGKRPSLATINRVLARHGAQDRARRVRRAPPPKGWYLPKVAKGEAELDCFDLIEDLKIADGPLVSVLTGNSLHGRLTDAWALSPARAQTVVKCLTTRWNRDGLPAYAQFDNDTVFQGAHQHADSLGRVIRLCLALGVTPVFAPPREHGFQNPIEGFNALWQAKVWQRHRFADLKALQRLSARYIAAHRSRNGHRQEHAPARARFPRAFRLDLDAPLTGAVIFLRRADGRGRVQLLGRSFEVSRHWPHRLVRCEVDLNAHRIRFYALRRRAPSEQPLLATVVYHRPQKRFQGTP